MCTCYAVLNYVYVYMAEMSKVYFEKMQIREEKRLCNSFFPLRTCIYLLNSYYSYSYSSPPPPLLLLFSSSSTFFFFIFSFFKSKVHFILQKSTMLGSIIYKDQDIQVSSQAQCKAHVGNSREWKVGSISVDIPEPLLWSRVVVETVAGVAWKLLLTQCPCLRPGGRAVSDGGVVSDWLPEVWGFSSN